MILIFIGLWILSIIGIWRFFSQIKKYNGIDHGDIEYKEWDE